MAIIKMHKNSKKKAGSNMYEFLETLENVIAERKRDMPEKSYTTKLFTDGIDRILQKIGEEATEVVIAGKNENIDLLKGEAADLVYHLLIMLHYKGLALSDIVDVLESRHKK